MAIPEAALPAIGPPVPQVKDPETNRVFQQVQASIDDLYRAVRILADNATPDTAIPGDVIAGQLVSPVTISETGVIPGLPAPTNAVFWLDAGGRMWVKNKYGVTRPLDNDTTGGGGGGVAGPHTHDTFTYLTLDPGDASNNVLLFPRAGVNYLYANTASGTIGFRVNGSTTQVGLFTTTGLRFNNGLGLTLGTTGDGTLVHSGTTLLLNALGTTLSMLVDNTYGISVSSAGVISFAGSIFTGTSYIEMEERAAPATPAANKARLFLDSTSNNLTIKKDSGAVVDLEVVGVTTYVPITGITNLTASRTGLTADDYLFADNVALAANRGWTMPYPGSLTAISGSMTAGVVTAHGTFDIEVRKNGTLLAATQVTTVSGADWQWYSTFTTGTYTFVAGDEIQLYANFGTFIGTVTVHGVAGVVYNAGSMAPFYRKVLGAIALGA